MYEVKRFWLGEHRISGLFGEGGNTALTCSVTTPSRYLIALAHVAAPDVRYIVGTLFHWQLQYL